MALPGEFEFYAAGSGLGAGATLAEHKAAYFRSQLPGDVPADTLAELEYAFYLQATGLTRDAATHTDARHAYFKAEVGHGGAIADLMVQKFMGTPEPPDTTAPTAGTLASSSITSTSFDLTVSGAADETALHAQPYSFSTDNGATWSPYQTSPLFSATGKTASTGYTCVHRTRDAAGNVSTGSSILVTTSSAASLAGNFLQATQNATNLSAYTFAGQSLGPASAVRRIVVGVTNRDTVLNPTSVTIGGVAATKDVGDGSLQGASVWSAVVPTGTTGDIVVDYGGTQTTCTIGVWALTGVASVAVVGGNAAASENNTQQEILTVPTQAGDFVVTCTGYRTTAGSVGTYTGATERWELTADGLVRLSTGADVVASGASTVIQLDFTNMDESTSVAQAYRAA